MKLLITGINGFIGTHLLERILSETDWEVMGFDLASDNLGAYAGNARVTFQQGDLFKDDGWLSEQVRACDVVLPLAGIAKPAYYIKKPVWTFELDFEQNLKIVRLCAAHGTRLVFPSTSEVYGMCGDEALVEDKSPLITGPIAKTRWIYSCSKQMMDRMIFAYAQEAALRFTIFRPFNWIGPRLDTFEDARARTARSITQMIYDLIHRGEITLVDGGRARRSFTWVGDAMSALMAILRNEDGRAEGEIFNIGNPANNHSIRETALMLISEMKRIPQFAEAAARATIRNVESERYYGDAYQDTQNRLPSVKRIGERLGWAPQTPMRELLYRTALWYAGH